MSAAAGEATGRRPALPDGPYLVVGLARSGAAAARMLLEHGEVLGCDAGEPAEAAALEGVELRLGAEGLDLLDRARTVVKSPGVPRGAPVVAAARERGLEVIGELEAAWRLLPLEFVAVTGTNGKTTTCEMLGAVHRAAGVPVEVAGNVGTPLAALVSDGAAERGGPVVVCECSSFQLEDASAFAPECAVLLNLGEDHLDRHGSRARYREAKLRIFARQGRRDVAVTPAGMDVHTAAERVTFGGDGATLALREGVLEWRGKPLMEASALRLRGRHNLENAMGAAAAALARGLDAAAVREGLTGFGGAPHRLEEVGRAGEVLFVNDSKATNPDAARAAVEAYTGSAGIHLILGGSLKGGGFRGLRDAASRCRACYLIGEAAERLAEDLEGAAPLRECGDLEAAVSAAAVAAAPGEVVLLSPACASFDRYEDYEARGDHFRTLARALGAG